MDFWKFKFYMEILGICFNTATALYIIFDFMLQDFKMVPFALASEAFGLYVMINYNETWKELLEKWKGGDK